MRITADSGDLSRWFEADFVLVLALVLPNENRIAGLAVKGDRRLQKNRAGSVEIGRAIVVDLDGDLDRHD